MNLDPKISFLFPVIVATNSSRRLSVLNVMTACDWSVVWADWSGCDW